MTEEQLKNEHSAEVESLKDQINHLRVALAIMLETFDHCGLRGVVINKANSKRPDGWTLSIVDDMNKSCQIARDAIEATTP